MELNDFNINEESIENFINEMRERDGIQENRFLSFEKYLKTNDFDLLMYRIVLEHGNDWRDKCYHNGYEPYPNNKLSFILNYVEDRCNIIKIKKLFIDLPNEIREFNGYYFQHIYGQGMITRIYNKKDFKLILQI